MATKLTNRIKYPFQQELAKIVSLVAVIGTCVFAIMGLILAFIALNSNAENVAESKEIIQMILTAILPLFGTWVGTILAFYYSKENLQAANNTVNSLVEKLTSDVKLSTIKVTDVMIELNKIIMFPYPTTTNNAELKLMTILDHIKNNNIHRAILMDEHKKVKYVIHKNIIEEYFADVFLKLTSKSDVSAANTIYELTFNNLLEDSNERAINTIINGIAFIKEDATLAQAKEIMIGNRYCTNIFVTKNASANESILGWITDVDIAKYSVIK